MSDVEKDIEVTPEDSDFEGHRQKRANDESDSDFEGHRQKRANDESGSDSNSDSDFEGHRKKV